MLQINAKPALIDQVYAQIKQAIVTGDLRPSASLAQEALAAILGVSRQPVSHALTLLEKEIFMPTPSRHLNVKYGLLCI